MLGLVCMMAISSPQYVWTLFTQPLVATGHFQDPENIPEPRAMDIVVVILWSRLGVPLPADRFSGALSGRCPVTGTEWEFEEALAAHRAKGAPDLLAYRKLGDPGASLADPARRAEQEPLAICDEGDADERANSLPPEHTVSQRGGSQINTASGQLQKERAYGI